MLSDTLNNISELLNIDPIILPNIITLLIVAILLIIGLSSQLDLKTMIMIYAVSMGILSLLGINSVFNIVTLISNALAEIIDLIFMGVGYGH